MLKSEGVKHGPEFLFPGGARVAPSHLAPTSQAPSDLPIPHLSSLDCWFHPLSTSAIPTLRGSPPGEPDVPLRVRARACDKVGLSVSLPCQIICVTMLYLSSTYVIFLKSHIIKGSLSFFSYFCYLRNIIIATLCTPISLLVIIFSMLEQLHKTISNSTQQFICSLFPYSTNLMLLLLLLLLVLLLFYCMNACNHN